MSLESIAWVGGGTVAIYAAVDYLYARHIYGLARQVKQHPESFGMSGFNKILNLAREKEPGTRGPFSLHANMRLDRLLKEAESQYTEQVKDVNDT